MCGFVGVVYDDTRSKEHLIDVADRMLAQIKHRGPDSYGIWSNEQGGIVLGHQRLSIIDLSESLLTWSLFSQASFIIFSIDIIY